MILWNIKGAFAKPKLSTLNRNCPCSLCLINAVLSMSRWSIAVCQKPLLKSIVEWIAVPLRTFRQALIRGSRLLSLYVILFSCLKSRQKRRQPLDFLAKTTLLVHGEAAGSIRNRRAGASRLSARRRTLGERADGCRNALLLQWGLCALCQTCHGTYRLLVCPGMRQFVSLGSSWLFVYQGFIKVVFCIKVNTVLRYVLNTSRGVRSGIWTHALWRSRLHSNWDSSIKFSIIFLQ